MLAKLTKMTMVIALAIVITILWTGVAVAQDTAGSGPDLAMIPNDDVMTLEEGEYHWYVFNYDFWQGKHTREMEPMEIRLYSFPLNGATLTLRNENQAERWRQDGVHEHFGCCTLEDLPDGNSFDADQKTDYATWSGKLSSGRYYIVVEHARDIKGPVTYQFTMSGDGFFFDDPVPIAPVEAAAPAEAPVPPIVEEVMPEPVAVSASPLMGTGPDYAMRPSGGTMTLQPGEYHWYAFTYDFWEGKHTREMEPMEIQLFSTPLEGATLTLRNEHQAELWRQDGKHEHFGCCTLEDFGDEKTFDADGKENFATWSGKLSSGRYYIVVEHAKNISGPVTYRFTITGDGVIYDRDVTAAAPAMPAESPEPMMAEELAIEVEPEPVEIAASPLLGTGPDYAMRPTEEVRTIMPGEYQWFVFDYDFWEGKHTRDMEPMEIRLFTEPFEGATLTLRNEEQAQLWRNDGENEHFGCCTPEAFEDENLFDKDGKTDYAVWAGKLTSGRYYIVVEHAKNISGPVTYSFTMSGDGFSY